ncbi:hypothetical protein ABIB51_000707 [Arthrobacter sp. UYCu712]
MPGRPAGVPLSAPLYGASAPDAVIRFFKKFTTFSGRASRSEYSWWAIVDGIVNTLFCAVLTLTSPKGTGETSLGVIITLILTAAWLVVTLVTGVALLVRRLHDANFSGWMALLRRDVRCSSDHLPSGIEGQLFMASRSFEAGSRHCRIAPDETERRGDRAEGQEQAEAQSYKVGGRRPGHPIGVVDECHHQPGHDEPEADRE